VCFPRAVCHPIKADKAWTFSWFLSLIIIHSFKNQYKYYYNLFNRKQKYETWLL
jgi:hypothetical protein